MWLFASHLFESIFLSLPKPLSDWDDALSAGDDVAVPV